MAFVFAGIVVIFTLLFALGASLSNTMPGRAEHSCTGCILVVGITVSILIGVSHYVNWPW